MSKLSIVVLLVAWAPLVAAGELKVRLNLTERAGIARKGEPVRGGVPLPPGTIKDVKELAVLDAAGKPVPAQFRVLNRHWDIDKSPKWVLCIFGADVPAKGKAVYKLVKGANPAPPKPVTVKNAATAVTVDTGPLEVVIDAQKFSLFKSVKLGGQELVKPGSEAGFVVEGMDGVRYNSVKNLIGNLKVTVLESGPVRANVIVEGVLKAGDNAKGYEVANGRGGKAKLAGRNGEKLGFTVRYEFYAGQPFCRVFHTVRCFGTPYQSGEDKDTKGWIYYAMRGGKPGNFFVKAAELVVNLNVGAEGKFVPDYVLGGDKQHAGRLAAGENAYLYQASSAGWTWQVAEKKVFDPGLKKNMEYMKGKGINKPYFEYTPNFYTILTKREGCPFMGYKYHAGKAGAEKEKHQGNRAAGWADISGRIGGATVAVRHFWQMYPKSLEVGADGKLTVGLWPKRWKRGHLFEGRIHRTHETLWNFHRGGAMVGLSPLHAGRLNSPVYVICDPAWYIEETKSFAAAAVAGKVKFGNFEDWALTAVHADQMKGKINHSWDSSIVVEREKYDEYGVWHFGDGSKGGGMWYFSQFGEFDVSYTLLLHGARTGDPAFWVRAEENARHIMGIPGHEGGYGHQWAESSHNWTRGLGMYYFMTGQYEAWESLVNWLGDFHLKTSQGEFHNKNNAWTFNGRNAAWAIRGMYNLYDLTGDKKYMTELNSGLSRFRRRQNKKTGQFGGGRPMSFQMGTVVAALGEHYYWTRDEEALDGMLGVVEYFAARKGRGDWVSSWVMDGYAYAYLFTGYDKYKGFADRGGKYFERAKFGGGSKNPPRYRTGTAAPKSWTDQMRNFQPYLYMKANPRKDTKPPDAVKDLAGTAAGGKVTLTWTAPGNDGAGGGKAAGYQVKFAKGMIVELSSAAGSVSFWAADNAKGEPAPGAPGAKETFTVSGLAAGTYHFALKTRDAADNLSDISNVVKVEVK